MYFTEGSTGLPQEAIGPIASLGGSVPEFLRKHIATCHFPGEVRSGPPVPLSGSAHDLNMVMCWETLGSPSFEDRHNVHVLITEETSHIENLFVCVVLMLYIPVNNFSVMPGRFPVFLGSTSTKQSIKSVLLKETTQCLQRVSN